MNKSTVLNCALGDHQVGVWYLGQVGILLKWKGQYVAIDPYLSDYVDRNCSQLVQWERLYAPPIAPQDLDFLDAVICTHAHCDHADPETLTAIARANEKTKFIVPAPESSLIASYGIPVQRIIPAYAGEIIQIPGFSISPIPSAHEEFHQDAQGNFKELGYILETEAGRFFHAGDMCLYEGLIEALPPIDMAFLPINGRDYFRNQKDIIGNFTCEEAVLLAKAVGADMLIPLHHDLYAINGADPAQFIRAVQSLDPYRKYHIFSPGEKYIFAKDSD